MQFESGIQLLEKLKDSTNFSVWKFEPDILLKANSLYEIVTGDVKLEDISSVETKTDWVKKDAKAQYAIIGSVDKRYRIHLMSCKISCEMYLKINSMFERDKEQKKTTLMEEFFKFEFKRDKDVLANITLLQNLANNINLKTRSSSLLKPTSSLTSLLQGL